MKDLLKEIYLALGNNAVLRYDENGDPIVQNNGVPFELYQKLKEAIK